MTVVTHKYLKNLYFKYKNDNGSVNIDDQDRQDIREYLKCIDEFKDKRFWEGAEDADNHARMFAKRLLDQG